MNMRRGPILGLMAAALLLAVGGCGGDGGEETGSPALPTVKGTEAVESQEPVDQAVDRAGMAQCLADAGVKVRTEGELPILSGADGIGVILPGGRYLDPGNVSAAVFVYDTPREAKRVGESMGSFAVGVTRVGNAVVMWGSEPDQGTVDAVRECVG